MDENTDRKTPQAEAELPAVHRELLKVARRMEAVPYEHLGLLRQILCRADRADYAELLEDLELRQRLVRRMGLLPAGFVVLIGIALVVATMARVGWLERHPFLGFGVLGGLLLLWGLRAWFRGREIAERIAAMELRAAWEEEEQVEAEAELAIRRERRRRRR